MGARSVVVLSGAQAVERAMQAAAVVLKPFTFDQLLTALLRVSSDDDVGAHDALHIERNGRDAASGSTTGGAPRDGTHVDAGVQR
jgi:hypothetical protein